MAKQPRGTCSLCGYEGTKSALSKHLLTCIITHKNPKLKEESENPFYCDVHMKKHPDHDYAFLPTVNSPRMGMCAYCGEE